MGAHSILPPSSAGIWGKPGGCTAWPLINQAYPERERTQDAKSGDAVHELGAKMAEAATRGGIGWPTREATVDSAATNGVIYDDEMYEAAELYGQHVGEIMRSTGVFGGDNLGIERRVAIPSVHELQFGTPDFFLFHAQAMTLHVCDLKYGHRFVDAFENWQEIDYARGVLDTLGIPDLDVTVELSVVQPRAYHREGPVRTWRVRAADLRTHWNTLEANAHEALGPNAKARTGEHCRDCPARGWACEASRVAGWNQFEAVATPFPDEIPEQYLGLYWQWLKRAREHLSYMEAGLEEEINARVRSGSPIPGVIAEPTFGRLSWKEAAVDVIAMGDALGVDLRKPAEPITPTQAKALAKKVDGCAIDESVIMAYSEKRKTGVKLVPDNGDKVRRIFNQ